MNNQRRTTILLALCASIMIGTIAQGQLPGLPSLQPAVPVPRLEIGEQDAYGRLPIQYSFPGTPDASDTTHRLIVIRVKGSPARQDYSPNYQQSGTFIYDPGCLAEGVHALSVIAIAEPRKEGVRTSIQGEYHANHEPKIQAMATRTADVTVTLEYDLRRSRMQNVITIDWLKKDGSERAAHLFLPSEQGIRRITLKNVPKDARELVVRATACDGSYAVSRCRIEERRSGHTASAKGH